MKENTITVKELEKAMQDQWEEIEELMERLNLDYRGYYYTFYILDRLNRKEDSKLFELHEAYKLNLLVKGYFEDIFIVDILIDDTRNSLMLLEDSLFLGKDSIAKFAGMSEEDSKEFGEISYYMDIWERRCAKKFLKELQKISDRRHIIKEKGIETIAEIHKRISNKSISSKETKNENKYANHKNSMENNFSELDKEQLLSRFNNSCALTGIEENIEFDHVIPISWRIYGTEINNIIPLNKSLNASKGNRNIFRWYEKNKDIFSIDEQKFKDAINYIAELNNMSYDEFEKFVYDCENKVIEKVVKLEKEIDKLEIEKAKINNKIFELKSEMTYIHDYDD